MTEEMANTSRKRMTIAVLGVSLVGALAWGFWQRHQIKLYSAEIERQRELANVVLRAYQASVVHELISAGKPDIAALVLADVNAPERARRWMTETINVLSHGFSRSTFLHDAPVNGAYWSPDGARVITIAENVARIWNADGTGDSVQLERHEHHLRSVSWSPDGKHFVTVSRDDVARLWDAQSTNKFKLLHKSGQGRITSVAWSPDGKRIATAANNGSTYLWNGDGSGEPVTFLERNGFGASRKDPMNLVAWSPNGKRIAVVSPEGTVYVRNADQSGDPVEWKAPAQGMWSVAWSSDGKRVLAEGDGASYVWNVDGNAEPWVLPALIRTAFSPDGKRIAGAATDDHAVHVWHVESAKEVVAQRGHQDHVMSLSWSIDGKRIVTTSQDKTARIWAADGFGEPIVLRGHQSHVSMAQWSPDGKRIITASDDKTARIWSVNRSTDFPIFEWRSMQSFASFSPDGLRILTAGTDDSAFPINRSRRRFDAQSRVMPNTSTVALIWNANGIGDPTVLRGHFGDVTDGQWSPDGKRVVTIATDKTARIWNADGSGDSVVLRGHEGTIVSVAWSPDGRRIATGSEDTTIRVWNADGSGTPVILKGNESSVTWIAWLPDGNRVVSATSGFYQEMPTSAGVRMWNADGSGKPIIVALDGNAAALSPNGMRIATIQKVVQIWTIGNLSDKPVTLDNFGFPIYDATWSPDGKEIATATYDMAPRIWNTDGSAGPRILEGHGRNFHHAAWSPDGKRFSSIIEKDRAVVVGNADGSGEVVTVFKNSEMVTDLHPRDASWSPDGKRILAQFLDGTARVWLVDVPLLQKALRESITDCLKPAQRTQYLLEDDIVSRRNYESCERERGREVKN